ncbi:MAG: SusD/RagB family nutrient-binding outer membrane lipoprotein, partial [Sphingobacteriaceae bacterium]
ALLTYTAVTGNDDRNFLGSTRNNLTTYRQTLFALSLLNGSLFSNTVDPRMSRMLAPAPDGQYRGLQPVAGIGALTVNQQPYNFWGYPGIVTTGSPTRYIFDDRSKLPVITYAQLQFIKAEAAYKKGDRGVALEAYVKGINAHFDFVNARNLDNNQAPTQISAAERAAYLASPVVVPTAANLTLSKIMCQKYIAQWGWGHLEQWMDLRRYHYTDADPIAGTQVFPGFAIPSNLYPDNAGKPVYRIRPRYNSEYVWNQASLKIIGGLALDYHTKPLWITEP